MKKCGSCGAEYRESISRCPKCGSRESFQLLTSDEALSYLDSRGNAVGSRDLVNKGVELFLQGRFQEAEVAYKQALEIFPENAVARGNIGHTLFAQGKIEEAIPWLEKALQLDPMLDGVPQALDEARQVLQKKKASLTKEDIRKLQKGFASAPKSIMKRIFGQRSPQASVRYLKKYQQRTDSSFGSFLNTYERYEAESASDALAFLETRTVTERHYYVEVQTPEGLVGKDIKGVYKL